jgi:hypothetical protein
MLVKFKNQQRINPIHNIIFKQTGSIKGSINYQKPENINKCISYLFKEDTALATPLEYGDRPTKQGRPKHNRDEVAVEYTKAIELAEQGNLDEAMEHIKDQDPKEYLKWAATFKEQLKAENKIRKYYELPDYSKATLSDTQKQVWELLQTTPKPRRIIWVSGQYGSGKSFLYQYIKSNHEYQMYDAGQSASLDNVAYGYDQEGVIAWDLPRTYDWEEKGNHIANVIEKFSDFGQSVTSKKYKGKTQQVRGHTIVFSNEPPIEQLAHRDIIHIELTNQRIKSKTKVKHKRSEASFEQAGACTNTMSVPKFNKIEPHSKEDIDTKSNSILNEEESSDDEIMLRAFSDEKSIDDIPMEYIEVLTYRGVTKYKVLYKNEKGQSKTKVCLTLSDAKKVFEENKTN